MSYVLDNAPGQIPVFGVDAVMEAANGMTLAVIIQDIGNIEYTGERVAAKDGEGKDVARVYFNRDWKSCTINCWPVGATEAAARALDVLFKQGAMLRITASTRYPQLVDWWRVTQCQNIASNTDRKMVSLSLEESISKAWPA